MSSCLLNVLLFVEVSSKIEDALDAIHSTIKRGQMFVAEF